MPHAYIVQCNDGSYYVGSTWDLDGRLWQHNHGEDGAAYTRRRRPVTLVWNAEFDSIAQAFAFEKRVQGWSRAKREALIRGDYDALIPLSRRRAVQERARTAEADGGGGGSRSG
jgi:predicted GIY-YIG superfamily endonuclease